MKHSNPFQLGDIVKISATIKSPLRNSIGTIIDFRPRGMNRVQAADGTVADVSQWSMMLADKEAENARRAALCARNPQECASWMPRYAPVK